MINLSICMMVKNEAHNLTRCLDSLTDLRAAVESELIIVDTGSSDETVAIAKQYTNRVYFHEWTNNFSQMRNKSISYANGEWIFIIDADEVLTDDVGLIDFLKKNNKHYVGAAIRLTNIMDAGGRVGPSLLTPRLFRNDGKIRYEGAIHNAPVIFGEILEIKGLLLHYGYQYDDADLMERKFKRTSELLIKELKKNPKNIYYRYQLGTTYDMHDDLDKACEAYGQAYADLYNSNEPLIKHLYLWGSYAKVLLSSGRFEEAVKVAEDGLKVDRDNIDLFYFSGLAYLKLKMLDEGIGMLEIYLEKMSKLDELPIYTNPILQLYTVNSLNECYYNLSQGYQMKEDWVSCLKYSKLIIQNESESSPYYEGAINMLVRAAVESKAFAEIISLYIKHAEYRWKSLDQIVYAAVEGRAINEENKALFEMLSQTPFVLGRIVAARIVNHEKMDEQNNENLIEQIRIALSFGWDEALYLGLDLNLDLSVLITEIDELSIMSMFSRLAEKYSKICEVVNQYLNLMVNKNSILDKNLKRILAKFRALHSFGTAEETAYFDAYINSGLEWVQTVYTLDFLQLTPLQWFRNTEEQFLSCVWNMFNNSSKDLAAVSELAVAYFPEWKGPYYRWLNGKLESNQTAFEESEKLFDHLMTQIRLLKEFRKYEEIVDIANTYLEIYPKDIRMSVIKSEALFERLESSDGQKN